ncbi:hypothetical protein DUNSADRAFT_17850, partial [Dunaliella salina]
PCYLSACFVSRLEPPAQADACLFRPAPSNSVKVCLGRPGSTLPAAGAPRAPMDVESVFEDLVPRVDAFPPMPPPPSNPRLLRQGKRGRSTATIARGLQQLNQAPAQCEPLAECSVPYPAPSHSSLLALLTPPPTVEDPASTDVTGKKTSMGRPRSTLPAADTQTGSVPYPAYSPFIWPELLFPSPNVKAPAFPDHTHMTQASSAQQQQQPPICPAGSPDLQQA